MRQREKAGKGSAAFTKGVGGEKGKGWVTMPGTADMCLMLTFNINC